jgi:hypothetical protein
VTHTFEPEPPFDPWRRRLLALGGSLALSPLAGLSACARTSQGVTTTAPSTTLPPLFDDIEQRTFQFFWDTANPANGLVPDRWPNTWASSIASVGFALTAYPFGVDRGFITRAQARDRVLATLRFFANAPQGPQASGVTGYNGFFYHFLDPVTGLRWPTSELSTVDTTLLLGGMLFCQSWFTSSTDAGEAEIRQLVDTIYAAVNWPWAQARGPAVAMGWTPEAGFGPADWIGYDEAMLLYVLALGSPSHPVGPDAWTAWTSGYSAYWGSFYGYDFLAFGPLFGHQFSHVWVDFRGIRDVFMAGKGIDYFENSRRATYAQQAYAIANPGQWTGYDALVWGLTACDGPANTVQTWQGSPRTFHGYSARGAGLVSAFDDGTIAPAAALSSLPFAPELVVPTAQALVQRHGTQIYSQYGFLDSFNPSFGYAVPLSYGRLVPGFGWVDNDYIGIDQGSILGMIANTRSEFVWKTMRTNPYLIKGLRQAGFTGGWLASAP